MTTGWSMLRPGCFATPISRDGLTLTGPALATVLALLDSPPLCSNAFRTRYHPSRRPPCRPSRCGGPRARAPVVASIFLRSPSACLPGYTGRPRCQRCLPAFPLPIPCSSSGVFTLATSRGSWCAPPWPPAPFLATPQHSHQCSHCPPHFPTAGASREWFKMVEWFTILSGSQYCFKMVKIDQNR